MLQAIDDEDEGEEYPLILSNDAIIHLNKLRLFMQQPGLESQLRSLDGMEKDLEMHIRHQRLANTRQTTITVD